MSWTGDWADWAGDNPVEAEKQLAEERARAERWAEHKRLAERSNIPDRDGYESAAQYTRERVNLGLALAGIVPSTVSEQDVCPHTEVYSTGHCADCGDEVEGFEPSDAEIFAHYGQTKEIAA